MTTVQLTPEQQLLLTERLPEFLAKSPRVGRALCVVWESLGPSSAREAVLTASQLMADLSNSDNLVAVAILAGAVSTAGEALLAQADSAELGTALPLLRYFLPIAKATERFTPVRERWEREAELLLGAPEAVKAIKLSLTCAATARSLSAPLVRRQQVLEWARTIHRVLSPTLSQHRHWAASLDYLIRQA